MLCFNRVHQLEFSACFIYLTLIPWLPCYITFISHKNDVIIIVKLLYRAIWHKCFITDTLSNKNTNAKTTLSEL